jgi:hypothetical protein
VLPPPVRGRASTRTPTPTHVVVIRDR